ncbi:MAG TPA: DUF2206 domain-containing protein [Candidatus Saccharimonadales bacterium]|nr:DUF2206 domain-containing protein [Candidatus Saccharimonadales bacterium]
MKITINRLALGVAAWGAVFAGLSITKTNPLGLMTLVGFSFLLFVPGYLTVLLLRIGQVHVLAKVLFAVGFSLIELMMVPALGNLILPYLGIARPLDYPVLMAEVGLLVFVQLGLLAFRTSKHSRQVVDNVLRRRWIIPDKLNAAFALLPVTFVVGAVGGAMIQNNDGGNYITLIMLLCMATYLAFMFYFLKRLNESTLLISLTLMGLALLLMTSLRGWYTTGHDVQREYHVMLLTQTAGLWSMEHLRDAYNACLSITILPTVFSNLLQMGGEYVYKTLFQVIFALTPAIVFLIASRFTTKLVATLAAVFFISFPTFFGDMPMLNRQEIAFVFIGLALLALFDKTLALRHKKIIFYCMSLAVIVSHYSTNYTLIGILCLFLAAQFVLRFMAKRLTWKKLAKLRNALNLDIWLKKEKGVVTITTVVVLVAASFLWSVQLTRTAGDSLGRVGTETVHNIVLALKNDNAQKRDEDQYSYVELKKLTPQEKVEKYFEQNVLYSRQKHDPALFYNENLYNVYDYKVVKEPEVALTPLGAMLASAGVPVETVAEGLRQGNADLRASLARFMQLTIIVGVLVIFFAKRYRDSMTNEYRLLQFASIFMLVAMIALPVLSAAYGLSRAFQQVLMLAAVPMVLGFLAVFPKALQKLGERIIIVIALVFFVSLSGIPTALFGGYTPQLHLFNGGKYYDLYYTHQQEVTATKWLAGLIGPQKEGEQLQIDQVFIDRYTDFKVPNIGELNTLDDVYPGLIRKDSYVFLGYTAATKHQVTIFYNGDTITYEYPVEFLDNNKNLIYSNGGSKVYK